MTKSFFVSCFAFLFSVVLCAQQKEMDKAVAQYKNGNIEKAIKIVHKAANKYNNPELWNMLVQLHYEDCVNKSGSPSMQLTLTILQLTENLLDSIAGMAPSVSDPEVQIREIIYSNCLNAAREANLKSISNSASLYTRILSVDTAPDSTVSEEAEKLFDKAEEYFSKKEYLPAKNLYLQALAKHPGYYKAALYAGDMYWHLDELDSALHYLNMASRWQPHLLEPRVYIIDALGGQQEDKRAIDACFDALAVYPNEHIFMKLEDLLARNDMRMNRDWIPRGAVVNKVGGWNYDIKFAKPSYIWKAYTEAAASAGAAFDSYGISKEVKNTTTDTYLELYSWEKMMAANPTAPELERARAMKEAGYLDCYIMICLFQQDFYEQYMHFVKNNRERVHEFCRKHLVVVKS